MSSRRDRTAGRRHARAARRRPAPAARAPARREPVAFVPALGAWLVTRREAALAAMRDDATLTVDDPRFSTARVVGASMLSTDGETHARHRGRSRRRSASRASASGSRRPCATRPSGLLAAHSRRRRRRPARDFSAPLAAAVMTDVLGLPAACAPGDPRALHDDRRRRLARHRRRGRPRRRRRGVHAAARRGPRRARRRAALVRARDGRGRPRRARREALVANAAVLLFGGIETTDGMIANLLLHVLPPGAAAAVAADEALLPARSRSPCGSSRRPRPSTATRRATSCSAAPRSRPVTSSRSRSRARTATPRRSRIPTGSTGAPERAHAPRLRAGPARLPRHAPRAPRGARGAAPRACLRRASTRRSRPRRAGSSSASRRPCASLRRRVAPSDGGTPPVVVPGCDGVSSGTSTCCQSRMRPWSTRKTAAARWPARRSGGAGARRA